MRLLAFLMTLGLATAAVAAPPPPPNAAQEAMVQKTSCPPGDEPAKPDTIALHAEAVPISALEGQGNHVGKLIYLGGAKLTADDPRFGDIIGLQFDPDRGLVAATSSGSWIVFDAFGATLPAFKTATVAPMRGLSGAPTSLARLGNSYMVAADGRTLERYELSSCGLAARAAPVGGFASGGRLIGMAAVAYSDTLYAGTDSTGSRHDLVTTSPKPDMKFGDAAFPTIAGYELVDVTGPLLIVPQGLVGLWRRVGGGQRTRVQMFDLPAFSDVDIGGSRSAAATSTVLGDIPLPMRAVTGFLDQRNKVVRLWMVSQGAPKQPVYVLAFAVPAG